jgi:hypothetical protein
VSTPPGPERVTLLFDVRSPWCYQTGRWLIRLAELGEITLGWGVFSLEAANLLPEEDPLEYAAQYGPALRIALALREQHGQQAAGAFYQAVGALMWDVRVPEEAHTEHWPEPANAELSLRALDGLGIGGDFGERTLADPGTWAAVVEEQRYWQRTVAAFGVPTLVFGGEADRRTLFGPVLRSLPDDHDALELWRHVRGMARLDTVYEVKRHRPLSARADLPAAVWRGGLRVAGMRAARAVMAPGGPHENSSLEWTMGALRAAPPDRRGQEG